jgi:hypothetical protein
MIILRFPRRTNRLLQVATIVGSAANTAHWSELGALVGALAVFQQGALLTHPACLDLALPPT